MKNLRITVNGRTYDVQVEEVGATAAAVPAAPAPVVAAAPAVAPAPVESAPAAAPAATAAPSAGAQTIDSPMPGSIVSVNVSAGDVVKKGQVLVVLEAMKMENEICAPTDGTVDAVCVSKGDSVNPGQTLVSLK
ncbi:MAG: biotin/lipoyl-binding protein [Clostridia bacterium]|nr:biotin/lipoyl-binding protein [Clostridia bacterium]